MWTIIKADKRKLQLLKKDFSKILGKEFEIYNPKIILEKYCLNKLVKKEYSILGNYLFCHHKDFYKSDTILKLKFSRGLKYFLNGFLEAQIEIGEFINKCKGLENSQGYLSQKIFDLEFKKDYKFIAGPFTQKIFKIISFQKKTIDIQLGNFKTKINKEKFLFSPV